MWGWGKGSCFKQNHQGRPPWRIWARGSDRQTSREAAITIQARDDGCGQDQGNSSGSSKRKMDPGCSVKETG